mmetsp:Transcript_29336/g.57075  ORF Transcript_29336/g.57075 Transcript_29336/m.57075 type:complete len:288 (+) Transcript_29336:1722-2585(+)
MDVEKILSGAIRFSGFVSVRLIFASALALLFFPVFGGLNASSEDLMAAFPVVEKLLDTYDKTIEALGIKSVAIYLIFFVFVTFLHLTFAVSVRLGSWLPIALSFESFRSVEGRFRRVSGGAMQSQHIDADRVAKVMDEMHQTHLAVKEEWARITESTEEMFNALKFFTLLAGIALFFFPVDWRFSVLSDNRSYVLGACVLACCFYAQNTVQHHRFAYGSLLYRLEGLMEKNLLGQIDEQKRLAICSETEKLRPGFYWKMDWTWPVFGSARIVWESINSGAQRQTVEK